MRSAALSLFLLLFVAKSSFAQQVITLNDAVNTALKNHWTLSTATNLKTLAEKRASMARLAFLPDVSLAAGTSSARNNLNQKFASGLEVDRTGVASKTSNASLGADLTLFNGLRTLHAYGRIKELKNAAEINVQRTKEDLINAVILNYYSVVRKKAELAELRKTLTYSEERVKIAEAKFAVGSTAKPELLQAKLDHNSRRTEILRKDHELLTLKSRFAQILGLGLDAKFEVPDSLDPVVLPDLSALFASAAQNNKALAGKKSEVKIAGQQLKETRSLLFPTIEANANYGFNLNQSEAGFSLYNRTTGLNTGLSLTWDIFSKGTRRLNIQTAEVLLSNLNLELNDLDADLKYRLEIAHAGLRINLMVQELEEENFKMAKENLDIATERYRLGMSTMLDLLEAQRNVDTINILRILSAYDAKLNETELKRLAGILWP